MGIKLFSYFLVLIFTNFSNHNNNNMEGFWSKQNDVNNIAIFDRIVIFDLLSQFLHSKCCSVYLLIFCFLQEKTHAEKALFY